MDGAEALEHLRQCGLNPRIEGDGERFVLAVDETEHFDAEAGEVFLSHRNAIAEALWGERLLGVVLAGIRPYLPDTLAAVPDELLVRFLNLTLGKASRERKAAEQVAAGR